LSVLSIGSKRLSDIMAREIKPSNPFLDDDEVDDDAFLNHPRQGNSGYMLGEPRKEANEWEEKRMQLLEERRKIEERTLQSTNTSLGLLHESEQVGILTAEELLKQREQLQNIEENLDTINNTMRVSQKHINSIKSIFGGIKNYFSKGSAADPVIKPPAENLTHSDKPPSILQGTVGEMRIDDTRNEANHPAFRVRDLPYDNDNFNPETSKDKIKSPTASSARYTTNIEGRIEQNLDHLSMGLGRLKNLAIGLNEEMEQQNDMIDTINNKADKADESLEYQNRQIKRILKK